MVRFIFYLILIFSISQASDFNKRFDYLKKRFLNMTPDKVVEFVCLHTKRNTPYHDFFSHGFRYTYSCSNENYFIDFRPYSDDIDIKNYKKLTKFVNQTENAINKTICKDPVFKASLHSNIRLNFKIYDSKGKLQTKFTYNRNSSPACSFY